MAPLLTWAAVCRIGREFPGVEESTSYGTAALKVRGKLLVRLREDGETLVLITTFVDRDFALKAAWRRAAPKRVVTAFDAPK
jgi:hypothetical protein